jgi:hypothetical protein
MNRWYSSQFGRFTTPDPYQASAAPANPQSWNRYAYVENDPVNRHDPLGLCPPGMVEADDDQMASIVSTVRSYVGQGISYSSGAHYQKDSNGNLTAMDCSGLVSQALAGISYNGQSFTQASTTFMSGQTSSLFAADSDFRVGDIIWFPGHVGIVTGVDASGKVTSFVGSQSSTGPKEVDTTKNPYWAKRLSTAKAYKPCVPALVLTGAGGGVDPIADWGGGYSWNAGDSFFYWLSWASWYWTSFGHKEYVTSTISYDMAE